MAESLGPVLHHLSLDATVFRDHDRHVTVAQFLADAAGLENRLPNATHVVNLCRDRYHFAVGLVAALSREQRTVLPMTPTEDQLLGLAAHYEGLYVIADEPVATSRLPVLDLCRLGRGLSVREIPAFPFTQPAVILFTSGSTGAAVPWARTWGALVHSAAAAARKLGIAELPAAALTGTVPHQHSYGLESLIMLGLQQGLTLERHRPFLPADIVAQLKRMPAPRILVTTPIHLRSLINDDGALPALARVICATAPLPRDLAKQVEERFNGPLLEIYGCTEVGQIAVRRTVETAEWACLDGIHLREEGGEVWASGASAATDAALNDLLEITGPDKFFLRGRKSDMVNIGGKRSSLAYLNFHLNAIQGVQDGMFFMQSPGNGVARLSAYVVAPTLTPATILSALRRVLDPAFLPRPIHRVSVLPRNELGKIPSHALAALSHAPVDA